MGNVKWGVLGAAKIAVNQVIPAILEAQGAQLYAIASRDEATAEGAAGRFGCRAYPSYERLLADAEIDAVYIPVPNALHMEWTLKAARAGKHVLCEKPMGLNVGECERMIEECEKRGVLLMEAFMYRYGEKTRLTLELVKDGTLGELRHINSTFIINHRSPKSNRYWAEGGGSLYDVGCYPVNIVNLLAKGDPVEAHAVRTDERGVDVQFAACLRYADGLTASVSSGFNSFENQRNEIYGSDGLLIVENPFNDKPGDMRLITAGGERPIPVPGCKRYVREIEGFSQAVASGSRETLKMPLEDTLRNMRLIDRLHEISRKGHID